MRRLRVAAVASAIFAVFLARAAGTPPVADLSITNSDFANYYTPGGVTTYTVVVTNAGPNDALQSSVVFPIAAYGQVASDLWTCASAQGAVCGGLAGSGSVNEVVDLPVGGSITYTVVVSLSSAGSGNLATVATVTAPSGTTDPAPANNVATDTDAASSLVYVSTTTGTDSPTCGPSATPCKTIQAAINLAKTGDTVVVAKGTYAECIMAVSGVGAGPVRVESDEYLASRTNVATFLDGKGVCDAASTTPGPVVKLLVGSSLVGFTVQDGGMSGVWGQGAVAILNNVITTNAATAAGGGVYLSTGASLSDPSLKALVQSNSIRANTSAGNGGGIYVDATGHGVPSVVEIKTNTVSGNVAGSGALGAWGGGIAVLTDTATTGDSSTVLIAGNTLDGNIANNQTGDVTVADGGGIYVATAAIAGAGPETITIGTSDAPNAIRNNVSGGFGGGISAAVRSGATGKATVVVQSNHISANSCKRGGGGAHLSLVAQDRTVGAAPGLVLDLTSNSLIGNHAQGIFGDVNAVGGGGLFAELHTARTAAGAVSLEISGNTIQTNDGAPHGGGASLLASADDDPQSNGTTAPTDAVISFHNNLVAQNAAHDNSAFGVSGGGIHGVTAVRGALAHARLSQDFLTVANNQTELGSGGLEWEEQRQPDSVPGGATGTTVFSLTNSIVSGNDGYGVGGTILPDGVATTVSVSYVDAFGSGTADYESNMGVVVDGVINFSADPELDAHFLSRLCGPTIDRGDPTIDPSTEAQPNGGRVNLGHLGNTASAARTFADVNGDGTIDGLDILDLAVAFGASSPDPRYLHAADRDLNGVVDGNDLAYVTMFYGQSCP